MNALHPQISAVRGVLVRLSVMSTIMFAPGLEAQTDNFNSGNDAAWTKYDLGLLGDPRVGATYTFPRDPTNGFAYRILVTGNPYYPTYGPGRASSYRTQVNYKGRFSVGVDLNGWNDIIDQDFGLFWYLTNPGLGSSDGYAFTYGPQDHLRISSVSTENPT
ncbi:MAG TPA: hypothetical protein VN578_11330, partial [Candidatus Binatia bacterium]|nr:hypothetical protein [Candidatus Binatia bacterium]